jgi:hypothetical protein
MLTYVDTNIPIQPDYIPDSLFLILGPMAITLRPFSTDSEVTKSASSVIEQDNRRYASILNPMARTGPTQLALAFFPFITAAETPEPAFPDPLPGPGVVLPLLSFLTLSESFSTPSFPLALALICTLAIVCLGRKPP